MARLANNGRELLRVSLARVIQDDDSVDWRRTTRTFHSNGYCLEKCDVRFKADQDRESYKHTWGWKRRGKIKAGLSPAEIADKYLVRGWTIEGRPTLTEAPIRS